MSVLDLGWQLRSRLPTRSRPALRRLADRALRPLGSLSGAHTTQRALAFTFDDGPDPVWTPRVLQLLADAGAHATFFVLTEKAAQHPALVRRMVDEGHEVGLHGRTHDRLTELSGADVRRRLGSAKAELETLTGRPVTWFRPPFGSQSLRTYLVARRLGLQVVVWGPYAAEWEDGTPAEVAARVTAAAAPGDIVLLHDALEVPEGEPVPTLDRAAAFECLLRELRLDDYSVRSVGELLAGHSARRTAWFRP